MSIKFKYSTPELIDLSLHSVQGSCGSGSDDVSECSSGSNAQNTCNPGSSASETCSDGSTNANPLPGSCGAGVGNPNP